MPKSIFYRAMYKPQGAWVRIGKAGRQIWGCTVLNVCFCPSSSLQPGLLCRELAQLCKVDLGCYFSPASLALLFPITCHWKSKNSWVLKRTMQPYSKQTESSLSPLRRKTVCLQNVLWTSYTHPPWAVTDKTAAKFTSAIFLQSTLVSKLNSRNSVINKVNLIIPFMTYQSPHASEMNPTFVECIIPTFSSRAGCALQRWGFRMCSITSQDISWDWIIIDLDASWQIRFVCWLILERIMLTTFLIPTQHPHGISTEHNTTYRLVVLSRPRIGKL